MNKIINENRRRVNVEDKNYPSLSGFGFEGIGKYSFASHPHIKAKWRSIVNRCYNESQLIKKPTYREITVTKEWANFQNFAEWYEYNLHSESMKGWHLDKDILFKGNKIYSPETCCFVPAEINTVFCKNNASRGDLPIGVCKKRKKFQVRCHINGEHVNFKTFDTIEEAFEVYKVAKEGEIKRLANKWRGQITEPCYWAMMNYQVEITD